MKLEDVISMYGKYADYQDPHTGYIYHISQMGEPDENGNQVVPVSENGIVIKTVTVNARNIRD